MGRQPNAPAAFTPVEIAGIHLGWRTFFKLRDITFFILILSKYEACPESNDTKVLNMYNIFNLQK